MALLKVMLFPDQMETIEMATVNFQEINSATLQTDVLRKQGSSCRETHPMLGLTSVPFAISQVIMKKKTLHVTLCQFKELATLFGVNILQQTVIALKYKNWPLNKTITIQQSDIHETGNSSEDLNTTIDVRL